LAKALGLDFGTTNSALALAKTPSVRWPSSVPIKLRCQRQGNWRHLHDRRIVVRPGDQELVRTKIWFKDTDQGRAGIHVGRWRVGDSASELLGWCQS